MPDPALQLDPGVLAYGRLSREEEKERGVSLSQKVELRKQILVTIARHHGFTLTPEQVHFEIKSGGSLSDRAALLAILERCRRGEVHTVIVQSIDRLTRDVADWKTIASAFYKGEVLLIYGDKAERFDRYHSDTIIKILAVLGEDERRKFCFRRKAANEQRARSGDYAPSYPPYGYQWHKEGRYYTVHPVEYPVIERIFARAWQVGGHVVATELNADGIVSPGVGKRVDTNPRWRSSSVTSLLRNPFYTGHSVKRRDSDREGQAVFLPRSQWIFSEEPLLTRDEVGLPVPLPHPVTREEWEALQELLTERQAGKPTRGLLTGLLYCSLGHPMSRHHHHYSCMDYHQPHVSHKAMHIIRANLERAVWQAVESHIATLRLKGTKSGGAKASTVGRAEMERASAKRELREKEATMEDLVRRASFYHALPGYGPERHADTLTVLGRDVERLRGRLGEIESRLARPDPRLAEPLLQAYREAGGRAGFLETANEATQRALLHLLIRRVDLVTPEKTMTKEAKVTFHALDNRGEVTACAALVHPATGTKRGPYLWRKKAPLPDGGEGH